ncbi:MAG TPA: winged helix DNA-binding domain-containing protein [Gaiella sp.]|nr:winged helix DNA-binding domain-containing protein [Gaiella sp.]
MSTDRIRARIEIGDRRARLARRHRLALESRGDSPLDAARSVVVLHSSDPATVFLSVWARTSGFQVEDLERELYEHRTLVRMLAMRRTLWVVPRELVAVVDAACTRTVAAREWRKLEGFVAASGVSDDPAAWLGEVRTAALRAIEKRGEAFTSDLSRDDPLLAAKVKLGMGTRWESDVSVGSRILPLLAAQGELVRGRPRTGWTNGQYRWTATASCLGDDPAELDQAAAQAELLRRWLFAFGPATETDLRWWMGWTAREARAALAAVPHVELDKGAAFVLEDDLEPAGDMAPWVALLPTLDPTTMGWKERDWYLGPHERVLFDSNGNAGPTVWCDGRVVGGWSQRKDGEIAFRLLEDVGAEALRAIEAEAARLADWLGDARFSPSFLPPFQRALAT